MRKLSPMCSSARLLVTIARRLIALCASLCCFVLMAASGPHLVHHLTVSSLQDSYHAHRSSTCLVLAAVSHTPAEQSALPPLLVLLPVTEQLGWGRAFRVFAPSMHISQARAPPAEQSLCTPLGCCSVTPPRSLGWCSI
jgi:hypothetical protein